MNQVSRSVFGEFVRSAACPTCGGAGRVIETPCRECRGEGRVIEERALDVDIPAGIHDGQRIRISGEGHAGIAGTAPGTSTSGSPSGRTVTSSATGTTSTRASR